MGKHVSVSIHPYFISRTSQQIISNEPFVKNTIKFNAVFSCDEPYESGISFQHFGDCLCLHHQHLYSVSLKKLCAH
jgi:hypothetical protein